MTKTSTGSRSALRALAVAVAISMAPAAARGQMAGAGIDEWFPRLRKGMWVKVEGRPGGTQGLQATEIKILNAELDESEVTASIAAIDPERRILKLESGLQVVVPLPTQVQSRKRQRSSLSALRPGDRIEAEGQLQKDGTLLVDDLEVKRPEGDGQDEDELTGRIESIDTEARRIVLLGIAVQLDAKTRNKTPYFE
jgi:hypothetical protein